MKNLLYTLLLIAAPIMAQSPNYYNDVQQLTGTDLKDALHDLIKNHNEFSYTSSKNILKLADEDPYYSHIHGELYR